MAVTFNITIDHLPKESTSWKDDFHVFMPGERHLILKAEVSGMVRERHLYGEEATDLSRLLGLEELLQVATRLRAEKDKEIS